MAVYVDEPRDYGATEVVKNYVGRQRARARWGHMIADTEGELHEMAADIGLQRAWYQGDHYDLVPTKRVLAICLGAIPCDRRALVAHLRRIRSARVSTFACRA